MSWLWVRDWILWVANFRFPFYEVCAQNQWTIKFWDPVDNSDTGGPSSMTVRMEYSRAFQYWYCALCVENRWGRGRKHCFVNSFFFPVFEGWWEGGREPYLGAAEITSFSSRDFSRNNKHDTFWHVLTTGYFQIFIFMNHCCFRFLSLGNL